MGRKKRVNLSALPLAKKRNSYFTEYFSESDLKYIVEVAGGLADERGKKLKDALEGTASYLRAQLYMRNSARRAHRRVNPTCVAVYAYVDDYFKANVQEGMSKNDAYKKALRQAGVKSQKDKVVDYIVFECGRMWTDPYIFQKKSPGIVNNPYKENYSDARSGAFINFNIAVLKVFGIEKTAEAVAIVIKELKRNDKKKDCLFPEGMRLLDGSCRLKELERQEEVKRILCPDKA